MRIYTSQEVAAMLSTKVIKAGSLGDFRPTYGRFGIVKYESSLG